jgi:hypothetical protein
MGTRGGAQVATSDFRQTRLETGDLSGFDARVLSVYKWGIG